MKNQQLEVRVKDDELQIRIGAELLAYAVGNCQYLQSEGAVVASHQELARDICSELSREEEDGTTPLHRVFDAAAVAAYENGSLAFVEEPDPPHPERPER